MKEIKIDREVMLKNLPRIEGAKISSLGSELCLFFKISYHSDLNVQFVCQNPLSSSLKNISFSGLVQIKIRKHVPITDIQVLYIRERDVMLSLQMSLVSRPALDFELGGASACLEMLGLKELIRQLLLEQLEARFVSPRTGQCRISEQVCAGGAGGGGARSLEEPDGVLSVTLVEARQLVNKDNTLLGQGVSDPYATLQFTADKTVARFRTATVNNCLSPVWEHLCQTPVESLATVSDLTVRLYDKDRFTADDPLGDCVVPVSVVRRAQTSQTEQDFWLMLNNVATGSVRLRVSWARLSTRPLRHKDEAALVIVCLHSCSNISSSSSSSSSPDPVVSVSVNKATKVSSKSYGNTDPIFEERLLLFSNNPTVDDVRIDVIDMKTDKVAGSVTVELSQLLSREDLCISDETFTLGNISISHTSYLYEVLNFLSFSQQTQL